MPLQQSTKSLPFVEGPDSKTDPKLSAKPALLYDAVFRRASVAKRWGRALLPAAISSGGNQTTGEALFAFNQELVRINGGTTYGYTPASQAWATKSGGNNYATLQKTPLVHNNFSQLYFDNAVSNGIGVLAWVEVAPSNQKGLHVAVYDVATGAFYQQGTLALASTVGFISPRCIPLNGAVVVVAGKVSTSSIYSTVVSTASPASAPAAPSAIKTDYSGGSFDGFSYSASYGVVAYPSTASKVTLFAIGPAGTVLASPASTAITPGLTGAVDGLFATRDTAGNVYVVYGDIGAHGTSYFVRSGSFGSVLGTTSIVTTGNWSGGRATMLLATGAETTTNQITVVMTADFIDANDDPWLGTAVLSSAGIISAFSELPSTQGFVVTSALTPYDGTWAFGAVSTDENGADGAIVGTQSAAYILTVAGVPVAKTLFEQTGLAIDTTFSAVRVCNTYSISASSVAVFFPEQGRFESGANSSGIPKNVTPLGICKVLLTKANAGRLPIIRVGQTEYIGGAMPRTYDGAAVTETGFELYPEIVSATAGGAGSGSLSSGAYQYVCLWSWLNNAGERTRSVAGPPTSITLGSSGLSVILDVATLPASTRDLLPAGASVLLEVYRTIANGTVFFSQTASALAQSISPTLNALTFAATTSGSVVVTDTISDTSLQAGEFLYTDGGILDWEPPPPYSAACGHNNRLIVISDENPYSWWPSSEWSPEETVRFSSVTANLVPADKGPLVGCASMDGKLILFAQGGAYLIIGDGPDLLGNNNYPPPQAIASIDAGPVAPQSIVVTPLGIMYQGPEGISLLDRGLNAQFIGADVVRWSTGAWVVRSATLDAQAQEVRFQADTGSDLPGAQQGTLVPSFGGVTLVYSYLYNQWSVFTYGGQAQAIYQGNVALVQSNGAAWVETPGTFRDNGAYYSSALETAWLKLAGLQGFQRIWYAIVLGTYASDFTFQWKTAYDYNGTGPDAPTYSETVTLAGPGQYAMGGPFQVRHHLGRKCEAVKFQFTDINIQGSGEGMSLTDLTLEYGVKQGVFRLPASKTA